MNDKQTELQALKEDIMQSMHCALPGRVESFDADLQTASVRPMVKTRSGASLPLLNDVPVFMPVSFSVNEGDFALVIFADADIDRWLETGEESLPASSRMHSLSDGFAFVGFRAGAESED